MEENLDRLKARRRGHRGVATKYAKEVDALIQDSEFNEDSRQRRLSVLQTSLEDKVRLLQKLDEDILNACAINDMESEIEEAEIVNSRIIEAIESCKRAVTEQHHTPIRETRQSTPNSDINAEESDEHDTEDNSVNPDTTHREILPNQANRSSTEGVNLSASSSIRATSTKPKLPKLTLPKFKGEVTMFQAFWDSFSSAVNANPNLSAIDKFNYLKALLEGPAA